MGKGINVPVGADTREFVGGVKKGVIKPLKDAADSLDDVTKAGDKAGEKLEDAFKDARDDVSDFKREQSELGKAMSQASKKGADDLARNTKSGTSRAKADLEELGREARANASETFSSFDGSAESFADGIQGTLGGIVSSMGPVGAALGAAGALGIGVIMAKLTEAGADTEAYKEKVAALGQEFIDTGGIGETSLDFIIDALKDLATETDDAEVSLKKLEKIADKSGSSFEDLAQAYAGNSRELDDLIDKGEKHKKQLEEEADALHIGVDGYSAKVQALEAAAEEQEVYNQYLRDAKGAADAAAESEARYLRAGGAEIEAKAALIDTINDAYDDAAGAVDDFIIKESGLFDVEAYLASMKAREKALDDYQISLASADLSPEAKSFLNDQGADAAATFLAGYMAASPANKRELNRHWSEAGKENSGEYVAKLKAGTSKTIPAPKIARPVVPAPDMSRVEQALARKRSFRVQVEAYARNGERIY